jgi:hypothetical protein
MCPIAPAFAAQPTPVPMVRPDLSSLRFYVGTWTCHQKLRGADRPDTTTYTMAYDGTWLAAHDVAPPFDKYRTKAIVSDTYYTFNSLTKTWVSVSVDNFGGYGVSTSPGWVGSKMVWTDSVTNDGTLGVATITKVSDTNITYTAISHTKSGKANPPARGVCTKS